MIDKVLKVHQVEERLLLQFVQLLGERVLLVLQDGAWRKTNITTATSRCVHYGERHLI